MRYIKKEDYVFSMPREHNIYLDFKEKLKEMGVQFHEEENLHFITITTRTHGSFEIKDGEVFLQ